MITHNSNADLVVIVTHTIIGLKPVVNLVLPLHITTAPPNNANLVLLIVQPALKVVLVLYNVQVVLQIQF